MLRLLAATGVVCSCAPVAAHAAGQPPPTPPVPAVSQYVEAIPTSGGPVASGSKGRRKLPTAVTHRIEKLGGDDAAALENVASSAAYGAPQRPLAKHSPPPARPRSHATAPEHVAAGAATPTAGKSFSPPSIATATETLTGAGSRTLGATLLAILAISGCGAAVRVARARR